MKIRLALLAGLIVFPGGQLSLIAQPAKQLLVLYKQSEGFSAESNPCRTHLHDPLSNRGYSIDYHDVEESLPSSMVLGKYGAVISWHNISVMKNPKLYLDWLTQNVYDGRKVIILHNLGAFTEDEQTWLTEDVLNQFFLPLGLEYLGLWTNNQGVIRSVRADSRFLGQEIPIAEKKFNEYYKVNSTNPNNQSYLVLNRTDIPAGESHAVVRTPFGGFALPGYVTDYVAGEPKLFLKVVDFVVDCLTAPTQTSDLPGKSILALLRKDEDKTPGESYINRFAFKPLLNLGYKITYHYVEDGLPDAAQMLPFQAVLTWFRNAHMHDGEKYPEWLLGQIKVGRKVVIISNFGTFGAEKEVSLGGESVPVDWWIDSSKLNNFLFPFGLEFLGGWIGDPQILRIKQKDSEIVEKDIPLQQTDLRHYYLWRSVHPENKVFLEVERTDQENSASAFVVRTPYGGMAFEGYIMTYSDVEKRDLFRLNLPAFLKECLTYEPKSLPQPVPLIPHQQIIDEETKPELPRPDDADGKAELPSGAREVDRRILAMYDGLEYPDIVQNPLHDRVEIILNHLGQVVEYWDIQNGLPEPEHMEEFRGIVTWFQKPVMRDPAVYAQWLRRQIADGRKVVILGNYGALYDERNELPAEGVKEAFNAMGLRYWDLKVQTGKSQKVAFKSPDLMDFEAPINLKEMTPFTTKITSSNDRNKVYLSIEDPIVGKMDAVVVTPTGGIALDGSAFKEGVKGKEWISNLREVVKGGGDRDIAENEPMGFWRINPFRFFSEALGLQGIPLPDVTTLNGLRIYYSHIDGDGLTGISLIDRKSYSSEYVRDVILKAYPLPVTASVISKDIEEKGYPYYNRPYEVARSIFALENIEGATHSYSHPYDWRGGDMDATYADNQWRWETLPVDYERELYASVRFIERNLLPENKKLEIFLWSGRCNPDERALSWVARMGIKNMNWGDPIYDSKYPSYSKLAPLATYINGFWQYHTSGANDFIYTKGWTRDFHNMGKLVDHFEHTESPMRILPINIYIHFYIGDRQEGLDGLKVAYDYCMDNKIAPLFTSEYVAIVEDFIGLRTYELRDGAYLVRHNGALRTIRFDNDKLYPDLRKSEGVLGYLNYQNSTYVHLSEGNESTIFMSSEQPGEVYLRYGSHYISNWSTSDSQVSFRADGLGKAEFAFANLTPNREYGLSIVPVVGTSSVTDETIRTDETGAMAFKSTFVGYQGKYDIRITKK
jgi:hypothetical protein